MANPITLEEAIQHAKQIAASGGACGAEHAQLVEWLNRLERLESIAQRLWPYVKWFGLCGADPAAMEVVAELADYLGYSESSPQRAAEIASQVSAKTLKIVANYIDKHPMASRRMLGGKDIHILAEQVRNLLHGASVEVDTGGEDQEAR